MTTVAARTLDDLVRSDPRMLRARIRSELGFVEPVGEAEALALTLEWERAHPPARVEPAQFDYGVEDGVLAALGHAQERRG